MTEEFNKQTFSEILEEYVEIESKFQELKAKRAKLIERVCDHIGYIADDVYIEHGGQLVQVRGEWWGYTNPAYRIELIDREYVMQPEDYSGPVEE